MEPGTETKAARTRRRILDSAAHELAARGYDGTNLRQVAAGADLQLGSLYFHFASKDQLLTEVLRDAVDAATVRIDAVLAELDAPVSGTDTLRAAITAHLEVLHQLHDRGAAVVRVMDPGSAGPADEAREHARRYLTRWRDLVEAAQRDGALDPSLDSAVVGGLLVGAMNATVGRRQLDEADVARLAGIVQATFLGPTSSAG